MAKPRIFKRLPSRLIAFKRPSGTSTVTALVVPTRVLMVSSKEPLLFTMTCPSTSSKVTCSHTAESILLHAGIAPSLVTQV